MSGPTVLHIVPSNIARGAQTRAWAIRQELDGVEVHHAVVSIFDVESPAELTDATLGVPRRAWTLPLSPKAILCLRALLHSSNTAAVVAYGSEALRYCVFACPAETPLIYSKTGVLDERLSTVRLRLHSALARRANWVAAVSEGTAEEVRSVLGVPPDRITVVSNGRDPHRFRPTTEHHVGPVRLVWVGHLTKSKRPERFVELAQQLRQGRYEFVARLIGDGPEEARMRRQVLDGSVVLEGRRSDIAEVLRESDVFVFTGRRDGEGMPGVLIEASLSGLPIVTTDVPGARDVVEHGVTGLVMRTNSLESLVDAVSSLVIDPEMRQRMGAAGRRRSESKFTIEASAGRWRKLFESVGV